MGSHVARPQSGRSTRIKSWCRNNLLPSPLAVSLLIGLVIVGFIFWSAGLGPGRVPLTQAEALYITTMAQISGGLCLAYAVFLGSRRHVKSEKFWQLADTGASTLGIYLSSCLAVLRADASGGVAPGGTKGIAMNLGPYVCLAFFVIMAAEVLPPRRAIEALKQSSKAPELTSTTEPAGPAPSATPSPTPGRSSGARRRTTARPMQRPRRRRWPS